MSISYDSMSAYMERESNRLAEQDKAIQKKIADDAIAKVMGDKAQINANVDNAVATAYRQNDRVMPTLKSETSQIANQATTENLVRGLNQNRENLNTSLDNLKLGIEAQKAQNIADIERSYGDPQSERNLELALAQKAQDEAIVQAQETAKAQEGYLDKLNELSRQNGYNYDFDADIFALEQQGYTNKDWQIQFLQEAKRLQTRNAKNAKIVNDNPPPNPTNPQQLSEYGVKGLENFYLTRANPIEFSIGNADPLATPEQNRVAENLSNSLYSFGSQVEALDVIQRALEEQGLITELQAELLINQLGYGDRLKEQSRYVWK